MNRLVIYSVLCILLLLSCNKKQELLDNEKLAGIIADMHIAEVAIIRYDAALKDSLQIVFLEKLEKIHKISKEEIKYQIESLMEDPSKQSNVYNIVIENLQEIEKEVKRKTDNKLLKNQK